MYVCTCVYQFACVYSCENVFVSHANNVFPSLFKPIADGRRTVMSVVEPNNRLETRERDASGSTRQQ